VQDFEQRYRQEHPFLGPMTRIRPSSTQKLDDTSKQGPLSRAVRKLTPRKSSLVNLLKGKGWNRVDESKPENGLGEFDLFSGTIQGSTSRDF
jgi:hypothetical protein